MKAEHYAALGDVVRPRGGADPQNCALIFEGCELSYGELDARSNALTQTLTRHGIGRGDRVAVLSKNNLAYVELLFGIAKAGAVFVPLNWRLAAPELTFIIEDAAPALSFVEASLESLISEDARTKTRIVAFDDNVSFSFPAVAPICESPLPNPPPHAGEGANVMPKPINACSASSG